MNPKPRADALAYDASPTTALARRGVRLLRALTFLTLVNTVMLGGFVLGPHLSPFLKQQWQQWQAERAQRKQRLAEIAVQNRCLAYAAPAGRVVYEEDPAEGARLLSADAANYQPAVGLAPNSPVPPGWQPPVYVKPLAEYQQFLAVIVGGGGGGGGGGLFSTPFSGVGAVAFLHERVTPGGKRRLVAVEVHAATQFQGGPGTAEEETVVQHKQRSFIARVYSVPAGPDDPPPALEHEQPLRLLLPDAKDHVAARVKREWVEGKAPAGVEQLSGGWERRAATLDYGNRLRVLAGRADPADPGHFTIPYRLDGRDGVIDGWLRDEGVRLQPRAGKLAFDDGEPAWDLTAPAAPATAPGTAPGS